MYCFSVVTTHLFVAPSDKENFATTKKRAIFNGNLIVVDRTSQIMILNI